MFSQLSRHPGFSRIQLKERRRLQVQQSAEVKYILHGWTVRSLWYPLCVREHEKHESENGQDDELGM